MCSGVACWPCLLPLLDTLVLRLIRVLARQQFVPFHGRISFAHSPDDGYADRFHPFVVVSKVAVTAISHIFLWLYLFFPLHINWGWSYGGKSLFNSLRTRHTGLQGGGTLRASTGPV